MERAQSLPFTGQLDRAGQGWVGLDRSSVITVISARDRFGSTVAV